MKRALWVLAAIACLALWWHLRNARPRARAAAAAPLKSALKKPRPQETPRQKKSVSFDLSR
jgi:hypothetical protein